MPLTQGQVLQGRYRIVKPLGQGGFGAVYRAWHIQLNAPYALKENLDSSAEATRQFAKEAEMLANLRHPNLPRVTDHFTVPGQGQYLVMDFIEGQDLEQMLSQAGYPLLEQQVLRWMTQICDALAYLHSQTPPIIHRDIKPANIKITPQKQAILVDFGIAKIYDPLLKTTGGARAVTPGFSPFEQYGQGRTDARSDVYALGATMYNLLTGQEPPVSIDRMAGVPLAAPRSLNTAITPQTEHVILRALMVTPDQRYQSIQEMRAALVGHQVVPPPPQSPPQSTSKGKAAWLWGGVIGIALTLILGGMGGWVSGVFTKPTATATIPALAEATATKTPISIPLAANSPTTVPSATSSPTSTPTATNSRTPIPIDTPTATSVPSATNSPTSMPTETAVPPTLTPNSRIAFVSERDGNQEIYVINADGTQLKRLTNHSEDDRWPAWSPDGTRLAFNSTRDGNHEIYVINANGSDLKNLTNHSAEHGRAAWSPDGTRIAFNSERDGNWEIYVMNADGSQPKRLTNSSDDDFGAVWSPDGTHLAFISERDGNSEVYVMNADGTHLENLTNHSEDDYNPAWSPDGTRLAFTSERDGNSEIYVMNADGSYLERLTNHAANDGRVGWSPDGTRFVFQSDRDGNEEIYLMNADGTRLVNLTNNPADDFYPAWSP